MELTKEIHRIQGSYILRKVVYSKVKTCEYKRSTLVAISEGHREDEDVILVYTQLEGPHSVTVAINGAHWSVISHTDRREVLTDSVSDAMKTAEQWIE